MTKIRASQVVTQYDNLFCTPMVMAEVVPYRSVQCTVVHFGFIVKLFHLNKAFISKVYYLLVFTMVSLTINNASASKHFVHPNNVFIMFEGNEYYILTGILYSSEYEYWSAGFALQNA